MKLKKLLRKCLPTAVVSAVAEIVDRIALSIEPDAEFDLQNLKVLSGDEVNRVFQSEEANSKWERVSPKITDFNIPDGTGGVNPGDRRAIFYLVCGLRPRSVLEIGTHIGASTVHIAAALNSLYGENKASLTSVDIEDVNNLASGPWKIFGGKCSPEKMISLLESDAHVEFVAKSALEYMRTTTVKYDLIFLDGDHSAKAVYREISVALKLLNPGGTILLHDYFPQLKPLWESGKVIPGPFLAVSRIRRKNNTLAIHPLGNLPWETKKDSFVTSLALLGRLRSSL